MTVSVFDSTHEQAFELPVDLGQALDAFNHPFAYAAFQGVPSRLPFARMTRSRSRPDVCSFSKRIESSSRWICRAIPGSFRSPKDGVDHEHAATLLHNRELLSAWKKDERASPVAQGTRVRTDFLYRTRGMVLSAPSRNRTLTPRRLSSLAASTLSILIDGFSRSTCTNSSGVRYGSESAAVESNARFRTAKLTPTNSGPCPFQYRYISSRPPPPSPPSLDTSSQLPHTCPELRSPE